MKNKAAVIGAGSWGTAIAGVLSKKDIKTCLWGHKKEHVKRLQEERQNTKYLKGMMFKENIMVTHDLSQAVDGCDVIVMAVPSQGFRSVFKELLPSLNTDCAIVSVVKGIENDSLMTMTQVMAEELNHFQAHLHIKTGVLSGPSFAREVADDMPTAVTLGSADIATARSLQRFFVTENFRIYASTDVIGLEISAAFKNIIAIATGICDGLGYGLNTRAALITRGLAEITRFGVHLHADPLTFSGLSGMGDLILTCTGDLSRNRYVGLQLGMGKSLKTILNNMQMVAEGVKTAQSGYKLTQQNNVEMPILEQVYEILYHNKDCAVAVKDLLSRELKEE